MVFMLFSEKSLVRASDKWHVSYLFPTAELIMPHFWLLNGVMR
jgi:hypothetical protein